MTKRILFIGSLAFALTSGFLVGCGDDEDDSGPVVVSKDKGKSKKKISDASSSSGADDLAYTYDALNRRDPFKSYFDELVLVEAEARNLTELQRIELDKLTLVAVVTGTATPMAMVQDQNGRGYTVKIGTLIGKRFGQVKHIRRGEIIVQEEFRDFTGKRIPVFKPLKLDERAVRRGR